MKNNKEEENEMKLHRIGKWGEWGYADENGNVVIPCQYETAEDFEDGIACVSDEGGDYYYINEYGYFMGAAIWCRKEELKTIVKASKLAARLRYEEAIECLKPIAEKDPLCHTDARRDLVDYLIDCQRYEEVVQWCEKTQEDWLEEGAGHMSPGAFDFIAWAIWILADMYENGIGVEKDMLKAFDYYDFIINCTSNYESSEQQGEAIKHVQRILKENPQLRTISLVEGSFSINVMDL